MAMQGLVRRGLAAALQSGASRGLAAGQQRAMSGAASYGEEVGKQRRAARAIAIPRRHRSNSDAEPPAHAFRVSARTAARLTPHTHARSSYVAIFFVVRRSTNEAVEAHHLRDSSYRARTLPLLDVQGAPPRHGAAGEDSRNSSFAARTECEARGTALTDFA